MRHALTVVPLMFATAAFAAGNPALGKKAHDAKCVGCHVKLFGGDGTGVYTRSPRLVNDRASLAKRVAHCEAQIGTPWTPEEERHIAAYLNQRFYHFD